MSPELENSGMRVAVGDCSVTECRQWRPPHQTGKTVHVHAKHYKHNEDGHTAPGVCGNGSVLLSHSGNVITRIGIHTFCLRTNTSIFDYLSLNMITSHPFLSENCTPSSMYILIGLKNENSPYIPPTICQSVNLISYYDNYI